MQSGSVTGGALLICLLLFCGAVRADRLYGNINFSYEHLILRDLGRLEDDRTRAVAIINYEDMLFDKNLLRLSANLQRREFLFSSYYEFVPIFILDLQSYGYFFNLRYSPYRRRGLQLGAQEFIHVYHRDWRFTAQFNYEDWPTFGLIFNRLANFDKEDVQRYDAYNQNVVVESTYDYKFLLLRASYNNLQQVNLMLGGNEILTEAYNGLIGINKALPYLGFFNLNYNYYDSRRSTNDIQHLKSFTHSITSMLSVNSIPKFTINANYSGRFFLSQSLADDLTSVNQNLFASVAYNPADYFLLRTSKGYQINTRENDEDVVTEYVTLGGTLTRFLRSGVDTRLTYSKTIYQQVTRIVTVRDSLGNIIGSYNAGGYALDTYQGAFNFTLRQYIKIYLSGSIRHNDNPIDPIYRYRSLGSFDTRMNLTRRLEARFAITSRYEGADLEFGKAYSKDYNFGFTYIPRGNLNINLTYIRTTLSDVLDSKYSSLTGYISYTFRKVLSMNLSINRQSQYDQALIGVDEELVEIERKPRSTNAQILVYLSPKTTVALAYLRSQATDSAQRNLINESYQAVLNLQF